MKIDVTLEEIQSSRDWAEVFGEDSSGETTQDVESLDGTPTSLVLRTDIAQVLASANGENDGDDWLGVFILKDGRYLAAQGWCDYTGWDCRGGNQLTVASSLGSLIETGLTPVWCERLEIPHPAAGA